MNTAKSVEEAARMSVGDAVNSILFENPFSKVIGKVLFDRGISEGKPVVVPQDENQGWTSTGALTRILCQSGSWSRLAGFSGMLAVGFGIHGGYDLIPDKKRAYDTAARHHLFHSGALLCIPLCRRPYVTGHLMLIGMVLFCGSSYVYALRDSELARRITPYGGILLLLAWASMMI